MNLYVIPDSLIHRFIEGSGLELTVQKMIGGQSTVHETNGVPLQQRNDGVAHV